MNRRLFRLSLISNRMNLKQKLEYWRRSSRTYNPTISKFLLVDDLDWRLTLVSPHINLAGPVYWRGWQPGLVKGKGAASKLLLGAKLPPSYMTRHIFSLLRRCSDSMLFHPIMECCFLFHLIFLMPKEAKIPQRERKEKRQY